MAITINDQPYSWSARGQKLMIRANSTETGQDGFQYGVTVTISIGAGVTYNFLIPPAADGRLYFDLQSLIQLRNREAQGNRLHNTISGTLTDAECWNNLNFTISEWYIIDGTLQEAEGSEVNGELIKVVNQYYQPTDGYKPNPETGAANVKFSLTDTNSLVMSDRQIATKYPPMFATWGIEPGKVVIPVREQDYGLLYVPVGDDYLSNNLGTKVRIVLYKGFPGSPAQDEITFTTNSVQGLPVFPANLNDRVGFVAKPSAWPLWTHYTVQVFNGTITQTSVQYVFWNECKYGNCECNWPNVRLAWVGARGGYEYWNFKKKSEYTTEVDRKTYKRPLFNSSPTIFYANDRGLNQRTNLAQRILTVTTDYISQEDFVYLRGLIVSNQVHMLNEDGSYIAVNIDDSTYVEKRTYDGKLYNLTLKVRMANEYWT